MSRDIQLPIPIDDVAVAETRRELDRSAVNRLAESIEQIGLRHPITVREKGDKYLLVAGRHRLEACKKLGREHIPAIIVKMTNDEARLWEIAENLHRSNLTNIQKAEHIEEWRQITERVANRSQPGAQPAERGITKAAEALGVSRATVLYANKIASIAPEAKEAATEAGVTSVRDLVDVSKEPTPEAQVAKVLKLAQKPAADPLNDPEALERQVAAIMAAWNRAAPEAREEFLLRIDKPIMDQRYA